MSSTAALELLNKLAAELEETARAISAQPQDQPEFLRGRVAGLLDAAQFLKERVALREAMLFTVGLLSCSASAHQVQRPE